MLTDKLCKYSFKTGDKNITDDLNTPIDTQFIIPTSISFVNDIIKMY